MHSCFQLPTLISRFSICLDNVSICFFFPIIMHDYISFVSIFVFLYTKDFPFPDYVYPFLFVSLALALFGSAFFVSEIRLLGASLLLLYLIPMTTLDHILPLFELNSLTSETAYPIVNRSLQNVSLIGALVLFIYYERHAIYLQTEYKEEVKQALLDFKQKFKQENKKFK